MFHNPKNYQAAVLLSALTLPSLFTGCNKSEVLSTGSNSSSANDTDNQTPETVSFSGIRKTEPLFKVPEDLAIQIEQSNQGSVKELQAVYYDGGSVRTVEFPWQNFFVECTENTSIPANNKFYSLSLYKSSPGSEMKFPIEADFGDLDAEKLFKLMQSKK